MTDAQSQPSIVDRLIKQSGWSERTNYMGETSELLWDAIDEIAALRAKLDELNERAQAFEIALRSIFEWYDTDGSIGGASDVFEDSRKTLAIYSQER